MTASGHLQAGLPAHLAAQQVARLLAHRAGVAPAALTHLQASNAQANRGSQSHSHWGAPLLSITYQQYEQPRKKSTMLAGRHALKAQQGTRLLLSGHGVHRSGAAGGRERLLAHGLQDDAHAVCGSGGKAEWSAVSKPGNGKPLWMRRISRNTHLQVCGAVMAAGWTGCCSL